MPDERLDKVLEGIRVLYNKDVRPQALQRLIDTSATFNTDRTLLL